MVAPGSLNPLTAIQPQVAPGNATATTPDPYPTIDLMIQAFPDAERATLVRNLPYILKAMAEAGFTSRNQLIAIMATIQVETIPRFAPVREKGGSKKRYAPYFGRGYIQLTWQANYRQAERDLNIAGLVSNPDLALDPVNAAHIFMWYWKGATGNNPSRAAERGDWRGVRKAVNGGYRGWDLFNASVQRCLQVFDRGIDPAAVGSMPVDGAYGLGCADPGAGTSRTISGIHNPQTQGDALAYALGLQALDSQRSHEFRGTLNVASDPTILRLDAQKTFELKGIADDLDGTYTCDEVIFYPLAPVVSRPISMATNLIQLRRHRMSSCMTAPKASHPLPRCRPPTQMVILPIPAQGTTAPPGWAGDPLAARIIAALT